MMQTPKEHIPTLLKVAMYCSELFIGNLLFYLVYSSYYSNGEKTYTLFYGFVSMLFSLSYCAGVGVRPITFFLRGSRRGSIVRNVSTALAVMAACFLLVVSVVGRARYFLSWRIILLFALLFLVLTIWRLFCRSIIERLRSNGRNLHQVVIVGYNEAVLELINEFKQPHYGYMILGIFTDEDLNLEDKDVRVLGKVSEVVDYLAGNPRVQQLYCSLPSVRATEIRMIINACDRYCVRFFSVPQVRNYFKRQMQLEIIGSIPVLYAHDNPLSTLNNQIIKRTFDLFVSGLFLIPFWLLIFPVIAVLTKILQPGPVFFKQKRNGLNGEEFYCYKFRSMKVNADADRVQATKDDPRKTPFGNFLRKSSIDELPQFINVFMGDMSIVGPRPHMVAHTEEYSALIDKYMIRHWVKPGITGWAQVNGARGETKELWQMEDRIKKDIWYIENWSLALDIKIIFLTVWNAIVGDKQAY